MSRDYPAALFCQLTWNGFFTASKDARNGAPSRFVCEVYILSGNQERWVTRRDKDGAPSRSGMNGNGAPAPLRRYIIGVNRSFSRPCNCLLTRSTAYW